MLEPMVLAAYAIVLSLLGLYGVHRLFVVWLYVRSRALPPGPLPSTLPIVTVQLPVFDERHVVARLIDAVCQLDWPRDRLEVQVLDDSTDATTAIAEERARAWRSAGVDVRVLRRHGREGYKAGALQHGLASARGELVAIFDADFVPPRDFLRRMVPSFDDARVGMVQARWGHLNEDASALTRAAALLLDGHFVLEHTARHRSGRFFNFNGTAGIWRRTCIEDAGGWQHDTLTEDLDLSYRAQLRGWRFVFRPDVVVPGELPTDMRAYKTQQLRWATGSIQTARKLGPAIARARVPWAVKVESFCHLGANGAYALVLLLAILLPASVAVRGRGTLHEWLVLDLPAFVLATGSVTFFYAVAARETGQGVLRFASRLPIVYALGIGLALNQTRAIVDGLRSRVGAFVRTPKSGSQGRDGGSALGADRSALGWLPWVELAFAVLYAVAVALAVALGYWASVPFLVLFGAGFAFAALGSILPEGARRAGGNTRAALPVGRAR
jgi:cellulose synthase/poly-beta-1,6-N-acetylglucosamine synthase-like glycosyltransferase